MACSPPGRSTPLLGAKVNLGPKRVSGGTSEYTASMSPLFSSTTCRIATEDATTASQPSAEISFLMRLSVVSCRQPVVTKSSSNIMFTILIP